MPDDGSSSTGFCKAGSAMSMYMTGFSFSLFNPNKGCLNLFFSNFTLDTAFKFLLAMVTVTCIGISVEGIASLKRRYISGFNKRKRAMGNANRGNSGDTTSTGDVDGKAKYVLAAFQGLQALIGYILMLSAMTFSIELLFSAVLGLSLGFLIFEKHKTLLSTSTAGDNTALDDGDGTPCCGFTEDVDGNLNSRGNFDYSRVHENEESSSLLLRASQERN